MHTKNLASWATVIAVGLTVVSARGQGPYTAELELFNAGTSCHTIQVLSYAWQPPPSAGKSGFFAIEKLVDNCSPYLIAMVVSGGQLSSPKLTAYDGNHRALFAVGLSKVQVVSVNAAGSNGGVVPRQSVGFDFGGLNIQELKSASAVGSDLTVQLPNCNFPASSWSTQLAGSAHSSPGGTQFSATFNIVKPFGSCSHRFLEELSKTMSRVTLTQNDSANRPLLQIEADNVKTVQYSANFSAGTETVSFSYPSIRITEMQTNGTPLFIH